MVFIWGTKRVGFDTPLFSTLSVKAVYNHIPFLSPQRAPCKVSAAEKFLKRLWLAKIHPQDSCGGVRNLSQFSRLEPASQPVIYLLYLANKSIN